MNLSLNIVEQLWLSASPNNQWLFSSSAFWWLDICFGHWPTLVCSMREPNLPGLLSFLGEVVKMIILVKEGIDKEMRFIFGLFHFQGVDHSGCLGFHHFLSFLIKIHIFFRVLTIIIVFQSVAHSCSLPPSSGRCFSWPSYSKSPSGGWSCWSS